jgi:pimeloyl-ACP methyl ester carboxylesterase
MLELIDRGIATPAHPVPLLFIHGGWHGAWCWDEHFMTYFADKGYRVIAPNLRGHGNSPSPRPVRYCSVADYVDDVRWTVDQLACKPILIGHSLGGFITQKYLESDTVPAAVLLAAAPPRGSAGFMFRFLKRQPWPALKAAVTGRFLPYFGTAAQAREIFFSASTPQADIERHVARFQEVSQRALFDTLFLNLPKPSRVTTPMLVLGAACDRTIITDEVHATARAYRTRAEIFPDLGHDMMLEPGWITVAHRIDSWLNEKSL